LSRRTPLSKCGFWPNRIAHRHCALDMPQKPIPRIDKTLGWLD
jgi:hypothetical protein